MGHDHSHGHSHSHNHNGSSHCDEEVGNHNHEEEEAKKATGTTERERRQEVLRKLKTASSLCFVFFLIEVIGGLLSGSLAVLSDAAHLAADLSAFVVAILGSHIAALPASEAHTFGLKRTESLAALFSMVSLVILSLGLAMEALRRIYFIFQGGDEFQQVDGKLMSTIAFIGVIVNVILAYVLGEDHVHMVGSDECHSGHDHSHGHNSGHDHSHGHGHDETESLVSPHKEGYASVNGAQHTDEIVQVDTGRNVNLHAAYLHVLADLAQSVVVFVAGLIIWCKPSWQITDPICTLVFSVLVCWSTVSPIRSSLSVLLEEVPPGVGYDEVFDAIKNVKGVSDVHDLHIWSISHGQSCLSVHAAAEDIETAYHDIKELCHKRKITHLTIQLQPDTIEDCVTCIDGSDHQCR
eukprot:CAMPEP_0201686486 /NCGR_PEP_ID=MMETSP0578-20130828/914_1 /ASSEMBLY_ACC=CAM_ASM_000663 /TAXON_ID=267565 /ORGANISM="Skeletonema grethea, Strain CCMP 1804" /LENGTH=407 /DNA_ID=CAMNT_0048170549 /DNA_START=29 /DNA_END=1252 /DNA_ORIENTATION=-